MLGGMYSIHRVSAEQLNKLNKLNKLNSRLEFCGFQFSAIECNSAIVHLSATVHNYVEHNRVREAAAVTLLFVHHLSADHPCTPDDFMLITMLMLMLPDDDVLSD